MSSVSHSHICTGCGELDRFGPVGSLGPRLCSGERLGPVMTMKGARNKISKPPCLRSTNNPVDVETLY